MKVYGFYVSKDRDNVMFLEFNVIHIYKGLNKEDNYVIDSYPYLDKHSTNTFDDEMLNRFYHGGSHICFYSLDKKTVKENYKQYIELEVHNTEQRIIAELNWKEKLSTLLEDITEDLRKMENQYE